MSDVQSGFMYIMNSSNSLAVTGVALQYPFNAHACAYNYHGMQFDQSCDSKHISKQAARD